MHGSLEQDVDLDLQPGAGETPTKTCPSCEATVPISVRECPICGYAFPPSDKHSTPLSDFVMTEIDLLQRSSFQWCDVFGDDAALIANGFNGWGGIFFLNGRWHAVGGAKAERPRLLAIGERLICLAAADDWLNEHETDQSAHKSKSWLQQPPTDKQLALLPPEVRADFGMTRYQASALLTFKFNRSRHPPTCHGGRACRPAGGGMTHHDVVPVRHRSAPPLASALASMRGLPAAGPWLWLGVPAALEAIVIAALVLLHALPGLLVALGAQRSAGMVDLTPAGARGHRRGDEAGRPDHLRDRLANPLLRSHRSAGADPDRSRRRRLPGRHARHRPHTRQFRRSRSDARLQQHLARRRCASTPAIDTRSSQTANAATPPRDYLGGSRLGHACERALQFEFAARPKDEGADFAGRIAAHLRHRPCAGGPRHQLAPRRRLRSLHPQGRRPGWRAVRLPGGRWAHPRPCRRHPRQRAA
jgi:hypothetical protein